MMSMLDLRKFTVLMVAIMGLAMMGACSSDEEESAPPPEQSSGGDCNCPEGDLQCKERCMQELDI